MPSRHDTWRRFVRSVTDYDVEGPLDDPRMPLTVYPERSAADCLLVLTKDAMARYLLRHDLIPDAVGLFCLHGPATTTHCGLIKHHVDTVHAPLLFYGDLDPMDLTTFATLRVGGDEWSDSSSVAVQLEHRGINDDVLRLVESMTGAAAPGHGSYQQRLFIPMVSDERRHFDVLNELVDDVADLVGPRCFDLLCQGFKLEVEALHTFMSDSDFVVALLDIVLGRSKAAAT